MSALNLEIKEFLRQAIVRSPKVDQYGNITYYEEDRALIHASSPVVDKFLAEFQDGHIQLVEAENIKFLDSEQMFGEYAWEDE